MLVNILFLSFSELSRFIFISTFVWCLCSISFSFFKKIYLRPYDPNELFCSTVSFTLSSHLSCFLLKPGYHLPHISVSKMSNILEVLIPLWSMDLKTSSFLCDNSTPSLDVSYLKMKQTPYYSNDYILVCSQDSILSTRVSTT